MVAWRRDGDRCRFWTTPVAGKFDGMGEEIGRETQHPLVRGVRRILVAAPDGNESIK